MHGLPHAVKDLAETAGIASTSGSPLLRDHVPDIDALVVQRMRAAGCIVIGKTNVPEFGLGSHTFNDVFGPTRNPYDLGRTAGGSSGGAAVALATRMVPVADGSDYMGSLRNPAAWNAVFGFRPSRGRVPSLPARDAYLATMSTEGPMGRSVLDVAMLLGTQAGEHPAAPLSLEGRLDELSSTTSARAALGDGSSLSATRVGWLGDLDGHLAYEDGILDVCTAGLGRLRSLGAEVDAARLASDLDATWRAWVVWRHLLICAGRGSLSAQPGARARMKPELLWEIDGGASLTVPDVVAASERRTAFAAEIASLFDRFDVLALPTTQVWPFPIDERWPAEIGSRAMDTYHRWMEVTIYATFAGLPAISVPVGFDARGLPAGMQLIGRPRGDIDLLRVAHAYETTIADLRIGEA